MNVLSSKIGNVRLFSVFLTTFLWLCSSVAFANSLLPQDGKEAQREAFESLEKAIQLTPRSKLHSLNSDFEALQGYPL